MPEAEYVHNLADIAGSVVELKTAVVDLTTRQSAQLKRTRVVVRWSIVGLCLDMALTLLAGQLYYGQRQQAAVLQQVQARSSAEVLCPLWDRFLDSYNPTSPSALQDPQGYENSFVVIEHGAKVLGCKHQTRGRG